MKCFEKNEREDRVGGGRRRRGLRDGEREERDDEGARGEGKKEAKG